MVPTAGIAVGIIALIGLVSMYVLRFAAQKSASFEHRQITWREYGISMLIITIFVVPLVLVIGEKLSIDEKLQYEEMRNGVETSAEVAATVQCVAGTSGQSASAGYSNCTYTFVSGSYSWSEPRLVCISDDKGRQSCTTAYDYYSANIYTPYAATELHYRVKDSLGGSYDYPVHVPADVRQFSDRPIPPEVPRGTPEDWADARRHLDAGDPRPVTRMFPYDNYILASQDVLLAPFAGDVQGYLDKGLLPEHTANILGDPIYGGSRAQAKKLSFVRVEVANEDEWQHSLMRFNAALGSKLQGDLHVVVIDSKSVDNPQQYTKALRAYWLGEHFGKRALSKNGVILVIGTSGGKIDWAQADTGMPFGNNVMLRTMENLLVGADLKPDVVFGSPRTVVTPGGAEGGKDKVNVTLSTPSGALETAMLGEATQFKRPCMKCEDAEDAGGVGYKDLIAQIEPSTTQKVWMIAVASVLSLPFWAIVAFTSFLEGAMRRVPTRRRYPSYY